MHIDIKYKWTVDVDKEMEKIHEFVAEINGEIYKNEMIFRKLYGITAEEGWGILDPQGSNIYIWINNGSLRGKIFSWDDLTLTDPAKLQSQIQARVNDVKNWMATLSYSKEVLIQVIV